MRGSVHPSPSLGQARYRTKHSETGREVTEKRERACARSLRAHVRIDRTELNDVDGVQRMRHATIFRRLRRVNVSGCDGDYHSM